MSRTVTAIERDMTPRSTIPPVRSANRTDSSRGELGLQSSARRLVAEWQQRGPETLSGHALRKLRLAGGGPAMLCGRSTRTGFYQMAIVLPATLMTRDLRSCSSKRYQRHLAD
jgi:hypothetical protein